MKTSSNHITNQYWVSSSACPYQGYGQSNVLCYLAWAVVKARPISRTIKNKILNLNWQFWQHVQAYDITLSMLAYLLLS